MSARASLADERLAVLEAAVETETADGGRVQAWSQVGAAWLTLAASPIRESPSEDRPPGVSQSATAIGRDHPLAAAGQRLTFDGEPPFRVRGLRRGEPEQGRMTLELDRLL